MHSPTSTAPSALPSRTPGDAAQLAERLVAALRAHRRVMVAFSGGVDSSVVAAAAHRALGTSATAVTADSPSVPRWQIGLARQVAAEIGISHRFVATEEIERVDYRANDSRRCYYCKQTLYSKLSAIAATVAAEIDHAGEKDDGSATVIVSGTNADDLGDHRPGILAGHQQGVATPLAELGMTKRDVRAVAKHFGLSNHQTPASPCLASRIAYGVEVTADRLARIDRAETWFRDRGFWPVRVRYHADNLARVELPAEMIESAMRDPIRTEMSDHLIACGFRFVTVDPRGLVSGNLNGMLEAPPLFTIGTRRRR